jgi:hypothetical protein
VSSILGLLTCAPVACSMSSFKIQMAAVAVDDGDPDLAIDLTTQALEEEGLNPETRAAAT